MRQAMIFAAGLGTRLRPLTDDRPKALVSAGGKTLLEHTIGRLKEAGAERIVVNVHHFAQMIVDFLKAHDNFGTDIRISDESDMLLDTGGGIKKARPLFDPSEPVLIHNVDIFSNTDFDSLYRQMGEGADALLLVSRRQTKRYLLFDDDRHLKGWTNIETHEVKSPFEHLDTESLQQRAFAGIHLFSPSLFPLMDQWPERFSIIDFYLKHCAERDIIGHEQHDLKIIDVGKPDTLRLIEQQMAQQ